MIVPSESSTHSKFIIYTLNKFMIGGGGGYYSPFVYSLAYVIPELVSACDI